MRLTDLSLSHRATVFFVLGGAIIAGLLAYGSLPRESSPDIELPLVLVTTPYPGASPEDVESQVTRPLEREIKGVDGLKKLTSVSQESASVITVEFASGTDIDDALQKVRDRVDRAEPDLPEDAEDPQLQEINFSDIPILQVHLYGDVGPAVLKRLAEELEDRIEALPGVLRVGIVGSREREVKVDVDPARLLQYGLSIDDVVDAVADENVSIPGGDLDLGDQTFAVRVPGEVDDPLEIRDFVIKARDGNPIFVGDVAEVSFGFEERTSYARIDGRESVSLSVLKRQGANIIELATAVRSVVEEARPGWPAAVEATFLADQSEEIDRMVRDLENNILSGLILVVIVLMFVLGFRTALFVGLAIPFSMLLTFSVIQASGSTLNMIVLFSLVLAVGMLVDNAVVVIENIYRHMSEGSPPLRAASEATSEVGMAILVSTLTTVGAFAPILFWPGVVGDFMFYLPLTVSVALLASLAIAFTVNPVLCATFLRVPAAVSPPVTESAPREATTDEAEGGDEEPARASAPRRSRIEAAGDRFADGYRRLLAWALGHRALVIGATLALFAVVLGVYAIANPGVEFFPETEPPRIFVDLETAPGTRLEKTDSLVRTLESRLTDLPDLDVSAAGSGAGSQSNFFTGGGGATGNQARIILDLLDREEREQSSYRTMEEVRQRTAGLPGVVLDVSRPQEGPPVGDPLAIEISGDDFETLGAIAGEIRSLIADIPGLVSLDDDFDRARPELLVRIDRVQAARLGLTTAKIATTVRTAVNGTDASVYRYGEDEADVVVRLAETFRSSPESLDKLVLVNETGDQIPLSAVADVERASALVSINHKDQKRVVTVSGKVTVPELAEPVRQEARRRIEAQAGLLPAGYAINFGGQQEEQAEAEAFLTRAFFFAILVVLALMVGKFDSLAVPVIILTSVAMSMIGVLIGLLVMDMPFGIIMTGLGVISLAGIVVNNAIVLLDYGEQLRARGVPRTRLVLETGMRRLRPVLLTAVTTILGLIPLGTGIEFDFRELAFSTGGESSQWWRSMAVAVIFGLAFATFLTLVLVPVLYDLLLEWRDRRAGKEPGDDDSDEAEPAEPTPEELERVLASV